MIGRVIFFVLFLPLLAALSLPQMSAAACSDFQRRATINEVYRGPTFFLEIKLLDPTLDITGWNVRVCTQNLGCTAIPLSSATRRGPYLIFETSPLTRDRLDFSKWALDILLTDHLGNAVDYLNVNNHSVQAGACGGYPYATAISGSTNSFSIARDPDGDGPFVFGGSGNSVPDTPGEPNDDDPDNPLPQLNGTGTTVARGTPAVFEITLSQAAAGGEKVSYQTVDDTAEAGKHYQSAFGTATFPAGATSVTVTVNTIAASPPPDGVYFWLNIMNPFGATLYTHFLQGTLVGGLPEVDHYQILHDGSGINCLAEPVTIHALNSSGQPVSDYTGTVNLSTSTNHGDWGLVAGSGSLSNGIANDGVAVYQFSAADAGVVELSLTNTHAESVNIAALDGGVGDDDSEGLLTFRPFGFIVSPDPVGTRVAGRSFNLTLTAAGQTPTQPQCGVITEYHGNKGLKFWSAKIDPAVGGPPVVINGANIAGSAAAAAAQTILFNQGVAAVTVRYDDAGQIALYARDDSGIGDPAADPAQADEVIGGVSPFVVRPFGFDLTISGNPAAADADGPAFRKAGENFILQVTAVGWSATDDADNDGYPDPDADLSDNDATTNFGNETVAAQANLSAALLAPLAGTDGSLSGSIPVFSNGAATVNDLQYSEVGIIQIAARTDDYLGGGEEVYGSSRVGRFTPHHFAISITPAPQFGTACAAGGFTYVGQPFQYTTSPIVTVTAKNLQNGTTANYTGDWWKITNDSLSGKTYTAAAGTLDTSAAPALDPDIDINGGGSGTLTFNSGTPGFFFKREALQSPFAAEISLSINVADTDGITPVVNPVQFGAATPGNGISFDSGKLMRYGRLNLLNAYGPEILPLAVPLRAEYYIDAANGWGINALDACTPYAIGDLALGPWTGAPGGGTAVVAGGPWSLVNGAGNLLTLIPPGSGKEGSVDMTFTVPGWLKVDRDGDGVLLEDPQARATFGVYKGNPRLIHIRAIP